MFHYNFVAALDFPDQAANFIAIPGALAGADGGQASNASCSLRLESIQCVPVALDRLRLHFPGNRQEALKIVEQAQSGHLLLIAANVRPCIAQFTQQC